MSIYKYKAIDKVGNIHKSNLDCSSKEEALKILKNRGLMLLEIRRTNINLDIKSKLNLKDIALLCRQLSLIISSDISIEEALKILKSYNQEGKLIQVVKILYNSIQEGNSLSQSMISCKAFPETMVKIIEVGEASGSLQISFEQLANQYEKDLKDKNKLKNSMIYPFMIIICMVFTIVIIMLFVIPTYINIFNEMEADLPKITLLLIGFNRFITENVIIFLVLIIGMSISLKIGFGIKRIRYIFDRMILNIPIVDNFLIQSNIIYFSKNMSLLLSSNVNLINSLEITSKLVPNYAFRKALSQVAINVKEGFTITEALNNIKLFPSMFVNMIKIAEESNSLIAVLTKINSFYTNMLNTKIEKLLNLIEPIITIILAIVIGFIMIAILLPTFSLTSQIL